MNGMTKLIAVAVVLLSVGCGFEQAGADDVFGRPTIEVGDPAEIAIQLWDQEMAGRRIDGELMPAVSEECSAVAHGAEYTVVSSARIGDPGICETPDVLGCFRGWWRGSDPGADIVLRNSDRGLSLRTRVHELIHAISACELGNGDADHAAPIWDAVYGEVQSW